MKKDKKPSEGGGGGGASTTVDVSRLDFKIGRILSVERHPDADSLYVEKSKSFILCVCVCVCLCEVSYHNNQLPFQLI